ncbi:MAG: hypothetical protein ABGY95_08880 [Rubritalea sp.]|uniref:hypothetical protein n=1 Tax=Rubritalea sp. TaxID=2109375 RepID=UPI003241C7A6
MAGNFSEAHFSWHILGPSATEPLISTSIETKQKEAHWTALIGIVVNLAAVECWVVSAASLRKYQAMIHQSSDIVAQPKT